MALLSTACSDSDPASSIIAPSLLSSSSDGSSAAARDFAVLAGEAVTCTRSTVTEDVGLVTGTVTQTDVCVINGAVHEGDAAAIRAYNDFLRAYDALARQKCDEFLTGTLDGVTLEPGVYCFDAAAELTGELTLDGPSNGIWIFKIGTSGTGALTGTNFSVVMTGGGEPCNVTWWVAEGATITDSDAGVPHFFVGTILAGTAITTTGGINERLTFTGDAFAKTAVTMTDTNLLGCEGGKGKGKDKDKCNQGVGNGPEFCDPGKSNHGDDDNSNDELGGTPGDPGREGGN